MLFHAADHDVAVVADAAVVDVVTAVPTILVAVTDATVWTSYEEVIIK